MSVPHSGTRTLVQLLDFPASATLRIGSGAWIHFGFNDGALKLNPFIHIPIRHPMDVAKSWGRRPKGCMMPLERLLKSYVRMFEWMDAHPNLCRLYRMESFPRLAGTDDYQDVIANEDKVALFQQTVMENVVEPRREFFQGFYGDLNGT